MAKTVTLTIRITTSGDGLNNTDVLQTTFAAGILPTYFPSLSGTTFIGPNGGVGNGTVLVPPKSVSGQPSQSGVSKTLVGNAADTGIPLDPASPVVVVNSILGVTYGAAEPAQAIYF